MVGVVDELDNLGDLRIDFHDLAAEAGIKFLELVEGAAVTATDNGKRRIQEVRDGHAFTQEFGVRDDRKVDAVALARKLFDQFGHGGIRSRRDRTADNHDMEGRLGADRVGNGADRRHQEGRIETSIRSVRGADAEERNLGLEHGLLGRRRRRDESRLEAFHHHLVDIALDDRRKTHGDARDLVEVHVAPDDTVTEFRETRDTHTTYISQPKNTNRSHTSYPG